MADPPENPDAPAPTPDDADTLSNGDLEPTHAFEPVTSSRIGTKIGAFTLKRIIGSGGMGTVYEAMQEQPRRRVAVKMIKRGITSKSALRRFEFESQLLGRLQHPGIAQVYEAGTHDDGSGGVPYFAMEYIANAKSLTQYAQEKKLGTRERLALFAKVCDAVQHGHLKGIVHRDLKPGNILVDSSGQPKIIDFGVARSTDSDMAVTTLQTDVGQLVGTLQYMSPEQVEADPSDIDARSDVYALGVVLYELLTSKPPYDVRQAAIHEAVRMVREEEPTKLSTIDRHLRGDIETIALKALEKERERRYQSATELEQDISRYLNDEPIAAKAPGAIDHLRRFARKHKAAAASIAAIFVVLVLALVAISIFAVKAKQDRDSKDAAWRQALDVQLQLEHKRAQAFQQAYYANIHAATAAEAINDLTTASQRLQAAREAYESSGVFIDGGVIVEGNWTPEAGEEVFRRIIDEHVGGVSESGAHASDPLPFEWEYLSARLEDSISTLHGHEDHITSVAYSHDGALLASGSFDKTIRLWDTLSGTQMATLRGHDGLVSALYFSPDGTHLISGSSGLGMFGTHDPDRTIRTWNTQTGEATGEIIEIRDAELVTVFSFSPDGSQVAAGCKDNRIRLWDVQTGEVIATLSEVNLVSHALAVVFSPDGFHLASSHKNGMVLIWDTRTGEVIAGPLDHGLSYPKVYTLAFSPDGGRLATGDIGSNAVRGPGVIRIFDTTTGAVLLSLRGHDDSISCIDFSPNGTHLASTSGDKTLRIWDTAIGEELVSLRGHRDLPLTLAFSPDGTHLASGGLENDVRFWDANSIHASSKLSGHESTVVSLAFSPDGTRLASGSMDPYPEIKIWDMASLEEVASWDTTQFPFLTALSYSSDGTRLASGGAKSIRIWDVASGVATDLVDIVDNGAYINSISLSLGGTCLATAHMDDTIRIWDIKSGEELQTLRVPEERAAATSEPPSRSTRFDGIQIALSPDGDLLASAMYDGIIRYWDVPSGEELVHLQGHVDVRNTTSRLTSAFCSIAFSPDGTRLATGGSDKIARIWDTTSGEELRTLIGHESPVKWVAFSPDSTRLLSSTTRGLRQDDTRLWDAVSGEQILVLNGGGGATAYSPDGTRLATSAYDNSIRLYNTRSRSQLGQERRQALNLAQLLSPLVESWMEIANGDSEVALALLDRESKNRSIEEATALSNLVLASLSTQIRIEKFYRDIETWWDNAETLNDGIWDEVTSKNKDFVAAILDEALRGMQRACELTHFEDSVTLDTLARVHYEMGELDKAILWQREAVKFIDGDLGFREGITQTLADYEAQRSEAARLPESAVSP